MLLSTEGVTNVRWTSDDRLSCDGARAVLRRLALLEAEFENPVARAQSVLGTFSPATRNSRLRYRTV